MRIISKFNDYYDNIGIYSDSPIWTRSMDFISLDPTKPSALSVDETKYLINVIKGLPKPVIVSVNGYKRSYLYKSHNNYIVLIIAGKLYHYYITCDNKPIQDIDAYRSYMEKVCETIIREYGLFNHFNASAVKSWYTEFDNENRLTEIHIKLNSPILLLKHNHMRLAELTINPCLKEYNLQKALNGWALYQSIEMFLSNQLAQNKEVSPDFGDEIKRDYHGMDEWSFKKKINIKKRKQKKGKIK